MRASTPIVVLAVLTTPHRVYPQAEAAVIRNVAVVGVGVDDLKPGAGGARLSADLVHLLSRGSVRAGIESVTFQGGAWVVGRIGGAWRFGARLTGEGLVTLGPGSLQGDGFLYRQARAAVSYSVLPGRLLLDGEGQTFDVAGSRGQIVAGGATLLPSPGLMTQASYGHSVGGNDSAEYLLLRAEFRRHRLGALGGLNVGRSGPHPDELTLAGLPPSSRWEVFGGALAPVGGLETTLIVSQAWSETVRRTSVVLITRVPVR
jgi:hypothetical protein